MPVSSPIAELHAVVAERPLFPSDRLSLAAAGLTAAVGRELRVTTGSVTGGGEQIRAAWRFWPNRPRVDAGLHAPAPWGGIWNVDASWERQAFTLPALPRAERAGARIGASDWITGRLRWTVSAGVDEWAGETTRGSIGGGVRVLAMDDRIDARANVETWLGPAAFATVDAGMRARSSAALRGPLFAGAVSVQIASDRTPLDLWWAGDTGHARSTLMRAHPVLDRGRLRVDRLGRTLIHGSLEAQRWWPVAGPVRAAAAAFGDVGRTGGLHDGTAFGDADVGIGARLALAGIPGVFRVDLAKGLRDGATALSVAYDP